jgi:hypothetical protein
VDFCLAENKEVKAGSNPRNKAKPSLPKEPELGHFCLTDKKKEVKAGSSSREKAKPKLT